MKISKTLSMAVAVAMAFVAGKTMASATIPNFVVSVSGTADIQKTVDENDKATIETVSVNNAFIFNIISNALVNASANSEGFIDSVHVPKGSYIAFNPLGLDADEDEGIFYVTNKDGFYRALSGIDDNDEYYSFMELDTWHSDYPDSYNAPYFDFDFGFTGNYAPAFGGVSAWSVNNNGNGSQNDRVTALLYVHDDPYAYDDADTSTIWLYNFNPALHGGEGASQGGGDDTTDNSESGGNNNAVEIRGILSDKFSFNDNGLTGANATLTGSGNLLYANAPYDDYGNIIKNATVHFSK